MTNELRLAKTRMAIWQYDQCTKPAAICYLLRARQPTSQ